MHFNFSSTMPRSNTEESTGEGVQPAAAASSSRRKQGTACGGMKGAEMSIKQPDDERHKCAASEQGDFHRATRNSVHFTSACVTRMCRRVCVCP